MSGHESVQDRINGRVREGHYTKRHSHISQGLIETSLAHVTESYQQVIQQVRSPEKLNFTPEMKKMVKNLTSK